jgi:hypothetical protein
MNKKLYNFILLLWNDNIFKEIYLKYLNVLNLPEGFYYFIILLFYYFIILIRYLTLL